MEISLKELQRRAICTSFIGDPSYIKHSEKFMFILWLMLYFESKLKTCLNDYSIAHKEFFEEGIKIASIHLGNRCKNKALVNIKPFNCDENIVCDDLDKKNIEQRIIEIKNIIKDLGLQDIIKSKTFIRHEKNFGNFKYYTLTLTFNINKIPNEYYLLYKLSCG